VRSSALAWLFKAFGVPKLRIAMPSTFKAAIRLAMRAGMKREACLRKEAMLGDRIVDLLVFGLFEEEV
jgi:RimJ/RimL family protein N-acetyltransferase